MTETTINVVIPAAGVGERMQADRPKQYLTVANQTVLQHTVAKMLSQPSVKQVILVLQATDQYFEHISNKPPFQDPRVKVIYQGGAERVHSVLAGLLALPKGKDSWVMVHDAARPNVSSSDIQQLIQQCITANSAGILATPVRDTMKRGRGFIERTESRQDLWHKRSKSKYYLGNP